MIIMLYAFLNQPILSNIEQVNTDIPVNREAVFDFYKEKIEKDGDDDFKS